MSKKSSSPSSYHQNNNNNNDFHSLRKIPDDDDDDDDEPPPMETLPDPTDNYDDTSCNNGNSSQNSECNNEAVSSSLQQLSVISNFPTETMTPITSSNTPPTNADKMHDQSQSQQQDQQQEEQEQEQLCVYDQHIMMKGRTEHPGLLEYDIAVQEFQYGVAAARKGQYNIAQQYICCAFLRNELSIQHVPTLPSALLYEEYDDASIHVMEHTLFLKLLNHPHPQLIIFLLMQICAGCILGGGTIVGDNDGKKRIQIAIKSGEKLLEMYGKYWIDDMNDIERYKQQQHNNSNNINNSNNENNKGNNKNNNKKNDTIHIDTMMTIHELLNGTLKLWRIHRYQSALHSVVSNFLMTYTELDAALQSVDKTSSYISSQIKYEIATLCLGCQLKPIPEIFAYLYQVIYESVVINEYYDTMCLPLCYCYLAMIACKNPMIIMKPFPVTIIDAFSFMEESDRCQVRYEQLHCIRPNNSNHDTTAATVTTSTTKNSETEATNVEQSQQPHKQSHKKLDINSIDRLKIKMEFLKLIGDPKHITIWKAFDQQRRPSSSSSSSHAWATIRQTRCLLCHKTSTNHHGTQIFKCTRCKNAFYCSKECQRTDWITHKNYCKQYCS